MSGFRHASILDGPGEVFSFPSPGLIHRGMKMSNNPIQSNVPAICVSKSSAAAMLNLSPGKFSELVEAGAMPKPRCVGSRRLWLVTELYTCAAALPSQDEEDTWGDL
ncbi:hypothetical protein [Thiosulfatihalobacter marinus]|uniref:hypothetical protein n=2 Tax=Thiosulfatihalobacter marinus TaxID=2792481 RepID=UPI0018D6761C|nr:hypothetical protein [Thiosulfatihalobacter marinus]